MNPEACRVGKTKGLDTRQLALADAPFGPESFDVITLIDVLEHLPNPTKIVQSIWSLLRPNGIIVVKVPNFKGQLYKQASLNFEIIGKK